MAARWLLARIEIEALAREHAVALERCEPRRSRSPQCLLLLLCHDRLNYVFDAPLDDVVLINAILSAKQLVVLNWIDFAFKMLPIYSMLRYLDHIHLLSRRKRIQPPKPKQQRGPRLSLAMLTSSPRQSLARLFSMLKSCSVLHVSHVHVQSPETHKHVQRYVPFLKYRVSPVAHMLMSAWVAVVMGFHVTANVSSTSADADVRFGCKAAVRPWLEPRFACAVMEINCHRRNISGSSEEINAVLAQLAAKSISSLIIIHCPSFEMPPRIQTLQNLVGMELTNVSIASWDDAAAFQSPYHDSLHFVSIMRTKLTKGSQGVFARHRSHGRYVIYMYRYLTSVRCLMTSTCSRSVCTSSTRR